MQSPLLEAISNLTTMLQTEFRHTDSMRDDILQVNNKITCVTQRPTRFDSEANTFYTVWQNQLTGVLVQNIKIKDVPPFFSNLIHLKYLCLSGCSLKQLPDLSKLSNLEYLDLSKNELKEIPSWVLHLPNLKFLDLADNKIHTIPENISSLDKIKGLILSNNQLKIIPSSMLDMDSLWNALDAITQLKNEKNRVVKKQLFDKASEAREKEKKLQYEGAVGLDISGNELINLPPELIYRGRAAIRLYWQTLDTESNIRLSEVKILLLGEGSAGKTSLLKSITKQKFDLHEAQTHGITIKKWKFKSGEEPIIANMWDFGGQEIMHATHQFFLSNRSLYMIVVDARKNDRVEYWLKLVEAFGGNSPTIIAITKHDENPGFDLNRKFLIEKYPNIVGFYQVSSKTGFGIREFGEGVSKALECVPHIDTKWPKTWFAVKDQLETMKEDFVSLNHYHSLCESHFVYEENQEVLLDFLHDLGVMLHFKDSDLRMINVLNPHWVTDRVYKIITSLTLAKQLGLLHRDEIGTILNKKRGKGEDEVDFLVSLMKKFELCYSISKTTILVPDLLTVQEPEHEFSARFEFRLQYDFLPRSILPRLMVRLHKDIVQSLAWRTGVIFQNEKFKARCKVVVDHEEKMIRIQVDSPVPREYFSIVRHTLWDIHQEFTNLKVDERAVIGNTGATVSLQHLQNLEQMGVFTFYPEGSSEIVNVSDTLGNFVESRKETIENEILQALLDLKGQLIDKATLLNEANKILELKPNILGIGININGIIDKVMKYGKR